MNFWKIYQTESREYSKNGYFKEKFEKQSEDTRSGAKCALETKARARYGRATWSKAEARI